jgi:hypothetical protein
MKKKLLTILFPVIIAIACSVAVWANEPSTAQPACDKCAKADKSATAPCGNCEKKAKEGNAAQGCDKCAKMKVAEAKPCGDGCDKCAKMQQAEKQLAEKQQAETKPCCNKTKQEN